MLERFKIVVPWLLAQLGGRKWLSERVFHMPERYIGGFCAKVNEVAGTNLTPARWRQVEAHLLAIVYDGLVVRVGGDETHEP